MSVRETVKAMFEQVKSGAPDMAVVKVQAADIALASREMPSWFPPGSARGILDFPAVNWTYISDVLDHAILPALTIVVACSAGNLCAIAQRGERETKPRRSCQSRRSTL